MKILIIFLVFIGFSNNIISQNDKAFKIIEKPITFNKEREILSLEYLLLDLDNN